MSQSLIFFTIENRHLSGDLHSSIGETSGIVQLSNCLTGSVKMSSLVSSFNKILLFVYSLLLSSTPHFVTLIDRACLFLVSFKLVGNKKFYKSKYGCHIEDTAQNDLTFSTAYSCPKHIHRSIHARYQLNLCMHELRGAAHWWWLQQCQSCGQVYLLLLNCILAYLVCLKKYVSILQQFLMFLHKFFHTL